MDIGILALQGGFTEIYEILKNIQIINPDDPTEKKNHINISFIKEKSDLENIDAMIIPGGESTSIIKLIEYNDLYESLLLFIRKKPVLGICAGSILLIDYFNSIPAKIIRNYFGSHKNSFKGDIIINKNLDKSGDFSFLLPEYQSVYFIRAPIITEIENEVIKLAHITEKNLDIAAEYKNIMVLCFHPEISCSGIEWFEYFIKKHCKQELISSSRKKTITPSHYAPWNDNNITINIKRALMLYLQGGVIMDVVNKEQAEIAEKSGAVSVMALEKIPADIIAEGGIARSTDPKLIKEIMNVTSIPVMAKARIGHFAEAQILDFLGVDCIDESEVLTCADELHHINKHKFNVPFVCGARDLGEALRRISEGASLIRLKGYAGTGNVLHAVKHARSVFGEIKNIVNMDEDELFYKAKDYCVSVELLKQVKELGRLPVITFAAGGLATPADVSLLMQLGCDGVFVGSGIFKGENPLERAKAMVQACTHYKNPGILASVSENLGKAMVGINK